MGKKKKSKNSQVPKTEDNDAEMVEAEKNPPTNDLGLLLRELVNRSQGERLPKVPDVLRRLFYTYFSEMDPSYILEKQSYRAHKFDVIPFEYLEKIYRDEDLSTTSYSRPRFEDNFFYELLTIALFTTKPGNKILHFFKNAGLDSAIEHNDSDDTLFHSPAYEHLKMLWKWEDEYLHNLLQFILKNRNVDIDLGNYCKTSYKRPLTFLLTCPNNNIKHRFLLSEEFNILEEYLYAAQSNIKSKIAIAIQSTIGKHMNFFTMTLHLYDRVTEYNQSYLRYEITDDENALCQFDESLLDVLLEFERYVTTDDIEAILLQSGRINKVKDISSAIERGDYKWEQGTLRSLTPNNHKADNEEEVILSFDINENGLQEVPNIMKDSMLRHSILFEFLGLSQRNTLAPYLEMQFKTLAGLVDPLTQPTPNDTHIISIDLLHGLYTGLVHPALIKSGKARNYDWKYLCGFNLIKIVWKSLKKLHCSSYDTLNNIGNFEEGNDWRQTLEYWIPKNLNTQDLELLYMIDILSVYAIYKLYEDQPIQNNPFLFELFSVWKYITKIIFLGLQVDRIEEQNDSEETPLMIRATVRGASAFRAALTTILNRQIENNEHDFKHEPINTFMSPHGRKLCSGSLYADMRVSTKIFVENGVELDDITNLLTDLQPGDRFDEDVEYMFDYEYEDYNLVSDSEDMDEKADNESDGVRPAPIFRRCNCVFEDDKIMDESTIDHQSLITDMELENNAISTKDENDKIKIISQPEPFTVRMRSFFDFNYGGKDWRDIPRGENLYYNGEFVFVQECSSSEFASYFSKAVNSVLDISESNRLIQLVASCIREEQDRMVIYHGMSQLPLANGDVNKSKLTVDEIYDQISSSNNFAKMLYQDTELACGLMDELLMIVGYRRVLIWFLTHINITFPLIHYIFELVMGYRVGFSDGDANGDNNKKSSTGKCGFSRLGMVALSSIEKQMLLQEFFLNATVSLSAKSFESNGTEIDNYDDNADEDNEYISSYAVGIVTLICNMVKTLVRAGQMDVSKSEYTVELQTLLVNWISLIPEAKELFFFLKQEAHEFDIQDSLEPINESELQTSGNINEPAATDSIPLDDTINTSLTSSTKKSNATDALSTFLETVEETSVQPPQIGRKVIYKGTKILPLPEQERPIPFHLLFERAEHLI